VVWAAPPPLDVVLLELPIDRPPPPVPLATDASELLAAASVTFVPNPLRSGWKVLRGEVLRRETHHTPAGTYDLVLTDLPVTQGDSGSGLYDARGQLVGINTWSRVGPGIAQGLSLPSEAMRAAIDAIRTGKLDQLRQEE
jgi:S1-C subfamily serine protease